MIMGMTLEEIAWGIVFLLLFGVPALLLNIYLIFELIRYIKNHW